LPDPIFLSIFQSRAVLLKIRFGSGAFWIRTLPKVSDPTGSGSTTLAAAVRKFKRWIESRLLAGNLANVLRYFPTQALNFAFKDTVKGLFKTPKVRLYNLPAGGKYSCFQWAGK
jgi:hypothetical protein